MLLDYLRALNNQRQDIPLAAVLASAFGGLTEEELAAVKGEYGSLPFCQAVFCYRAEGKNPAIR